MSLRPATLRTGIARLRSIRTAGLLLAEWIFKVVAAVVRGYAVKTALIESAARAMSGMRKDKPVTPASDLFAERGVTTGCG